MWGLFSLSLYAFTLSYLSIVVRQYPTVFPTFEWYLNGIQMWYVCVHSLFSG